MTISEQQRLHLFKTLEQRLGDDDAATMMELLPPVGWADVARKDDLDALAGRLRAEVKADLLELEVRLQRSILTTVLTGMGIQTAILGLLIGIL
jgi:hypothetical protein